MSPIIDSLENCPRRFIGKLEIKFQTSYYRLVYQHPVTKLPLRNNMSMTWNFQTTRPSLGNNHQHRNIIHYRYRL